MPQLDFYAYQSELTWFLICFWALYFFNLLVVVPSLLKSILFIQLAKLSFFQVEIDGDSCFFVELKDLRFSLFTKRYNSLVLLNTEELSSGLSLINSVYN